MASVSALEKRNLHIAALVIGFIGAMMILVATFDCLGQSKYKVKIEESIKKRLTEKTTATSKISYKLFQSWGVYRQCTSLTDSSVSSKQNKTTCHSYSASDYDDNRRKRLWNSMFFVTSASKILGMAFVVLLFVSLFHMGAQKRQNIRWGTLGVGLTFMLGVVAALVLFVFWNKSMVQGKLLPDSVFGIDGNGNNWVYGQGMYAGSAGLTMLLVSVVLTGVTTLPTKISS